MNEEQLETFSAFNQTPMNFPLYLSAHYKGEEIQLF